MGEVTGKEFDELHRRERREKCSRKELFHRCETAEEEKDGRAASSKMACGRRTKEGTKTGGLRGRGRKTSRFFLRHRTRERCVESR